MGHWQRLTAIVCAAAVGLGVSASSAGAERYRRTFSWSGFTWQVRLATRENPGRNTWWDAPANVRVRRDGSLRLAITRAGRTWRSVEIATKRRLGYGRYRWVVGSRLDALDPHAVVALFTDDSVHKSPYGEQIFEFSRWNDPTLQPGWAVSWSRRKKSFDSFALTAAAPYTVDVVWASSTVRQRMVDGSGAVLFDHTWTLRSDGRFMLARMSYWLFRGPPADGRVQPPAIVEDFGFTPPARVGAGDS
jgi:hypothetical protein